MVCSFNSSYLTLSLVTALVYPASLDAGCCPKGEYLESKRKSQIVSEVGTVHVSQSIGMYGQGRTVEPGTERREDHVDVLPWSILARTEDCSGMKWY